jgi:hypothetical protein
MGDDVVDRARYLVDRLEDGDTLALLPLRSSRLAGWDPEPWVRDVWQGGLSRLAGAPPRAVIRARAVSPFAARLVLEGAVGQAFVTVRFDEVGQLDGVAVRADEREGINGIVINCPDERRDELRAFYASFVDGPFVFDEGDDYHRPQWPDPDHPQQVHLDVRVVDLDAATALVRGRGATLLRDNGDEHRVFADPIGHPFCLYRDGHPGLWRIVFDCEDPAPLRALYDALLPNDGTTSPVLAFQRIERYVRPRWPDPAHPAQLHLDLSFDDRDAAAALAISLGATRLPPQGGSCPVYADPAGHPFCLCLPGE